MTLEEALARIGALEAELGNKDTEINALKEVAKSSVSAEELDKIKQKVFNQGFDKAKNQFEIDKEGFIKKEDVDNMLSERDALNQKKVELFKMGIKNPDTALKIIEKDDLNAIGTADFKADDFKAKYADDIVFGGGSGTHKPRTRNNDTADIKVTAENYNELSDTQKAKMSDSDKLALL